MGSATALAVSALAIACGPPPVPEGAHEYVVFQGLNRPTSLAFAPDGRVFVAEKRGVLKVFDSLDDPQPTVVADLRTQVHNFWDRGLLDIALPPDFATDPSIYVLYTRDAPLGEEAPRWGTPGADNDNCPTPPGPTDDGCVVSGRLSRLDLEGNTRTGSEHVVLDGWCQQFPSHSMGSLAFGPDGALYVSGGEGSSFHHADYGQFGSPLNPCGDPPSGVGGVQTPPTGEGGALRAQDLRTPGDPTGFNGALLRIDPDTGAARPDNPLAGSPDPGARRVVAHGFRNPFRFALRPGTDEVWVADVGWDRYEEIDRTIGDDAVVDNFGWPCYEGPERQPAYDVVDLDICEQLYAAGTPPGTAAKAPFWSYQRAKGIVPGEKCDTQNGSSISGIAFAPDDTVYPDDYGRLFFSDAARVCIWSMATGADGQPDPSTVQAFVNPAASPVDLQFGPDGELWFVDIWGGTVRRIGYVGANHPPVAAVGAQPTSGDAPLAVRLDATGSTDADPGDELTYAWDVDNDGAFDDGDRAVLDTTFTTDGLKVIRVRVTDVSGDYDVGVTTVVVGQSNVPAAIITQPADVTVAAVGDTVEFAGAAATGSGQLLPVETMRWSADLLHCPDACHRHPDVFAADGVLGGSLTMPDHEYPASLELRLSVTWDGITTTTTRTVDYAPTDLTLRSEPAGVVLAAGTRAAPAPFTQAFATNGAVTLSAPATATIGGVVHTFAGWSDGGARSHDIVVPADPAPYTATYVPSG